MSAQIALIEWLRARDKKRYGLWITHNTAKGAAADLLAALDEAGFALVSKEPQPRIIAAVFVQTQEPSSADFAIAQQALTLIPASPVEKVTEALSDISRDYRAMVAAQVKP